MIVISVMLLLAAIELFIEHEIRKNRK